VVLNVRVVSGAGGGPDITLIRSGNHFRRYWPAVAYMHAPHDAAFAALPRLAAAHAYPLVGIHDRGALDPRVPRELLALCRHLGVRIWHGRDYKANAIGLLLRRLHPMALISSAHGWVTHTRRTPLYYAMDRFCLRRSDHVIAVSPDLQAAVRALGIPAMRCSLLPNGVDERVFARRSPAAQSPLRARRGVAAGRTVIGALGRLSTEKGFDDLIRATHALIRAGCDVELWIAGEGPARGELQALIDRLGLADRIALLGFVEQTVELLHGLDLYALSSVREGLPIALLEAMAMRLPVVATAVGGVPTLLRDGANGVLVAPRDVDGLAAALHRLLQDLPLRDRLAAAARRTIEERFTLSARVAAEEAIYDHVLSLAGAAPSAPERGR
jgi:glycosyltransferase involved in cell wall biosynthesis